MDAFSIDARISFIDGGPENLAKRQFEIPDTRGIGIRRIVREDLEQRLSDDVLAVVCKAGAPTEIAGSQAFTTPMDRPDRFRSPRNQQHCG